MAEPIQIVGLDQFVRNLRKLDNDLPKAMRLAFNEAADVVLTGARPRVPRRSGRAKASLKVKSTTKSSRISGGGSKAPYYPWLDFGGRVGEGGRIRRPFLKEGRYLYRSFHDNRSKFISVMEDQLITVVRQSGLEVD